MQKKYTLFSLIRWNIKHGNRIGIYLLFLITLCLNIAFCYFLYGLLIEYIDIPYKYIQQIPYDLDESQIYIIGLVLISFVMWVVMLVRPVGGEEFDRKVKKQELDERFGRISQEKAVKKYNAPSISLARFGKGEKRLRAKNHNKGLIGINPDNHKGHILTVAPTQTGKGLQLTQLLENWTHSAVVIDPKGEQYSRLVGLKESRPYALPQDSISLSALYGLDGDEYTPEISNNLTTLYKNLMKVNEHSSDGFWDTMGLPLLRACWKYAKTINADPLRVFFDMALSSPVEALPALHKVAPEDVNQFAPSLKNIADNKMILSGWGTLTSKLSSYQDVIDMIAPPPNRSNVIPLDFATRGELIYITFDFPMMKAQAGLLGAILGGITMNHQRQYSRYQTKPLMLMAIDELPTVAPVDLAEYLSTQTSYGIRYLLYVQNVNQLVSIYGQSKADDLISACKYRAFYKPNDMKTAQYMADIRGQTIQVNASYSDREKETQGSRGERTDYVLSPHEAMKLDEDKVLIQINKDNFIAQRIYIVPGLKAGLYNDFEPIKPLWTKQRKVIKWVSDRPLDPVINLPSTRDIDDDLI